MLEFKKKLKELCCEIFRYLFVCSLAFVIDSAVLYVFRECIFRNQRPIFLFIATALGFVAGLVVNYVLSIVYVFQGQANRERGKKVSAFVIFTLVGLIGLGLTEVGMYIGVYELGWNLLLTKVLVAGAVLVWNYCGRKVLIFKGE